MIDKDDFWQHAQDTIDNISTDDDCVELRKCIGLSYLYVFHYARERFINHPEAQFATLPNYLQHREFQDFFERKNLDFIANKIFAITKDRNDADYDLKKNINKNKTISHMKNVNNLIERMDKINPT